MLEYGIQGIFDRMQKSDDSQDTMQSNQQTNNVVESNSSNKLIALDNELGRKVESMACSHGEESSSHLPPNDKIQCRIDRMQKSDNSQDAMQNKELRNNVVESNSPDKSITLESELGRNGESMASNHGHEGSPNYPRFD